MNPIGRRRVRGAGPRTGRSSTACSSRCAAGCRRACWSAPTTPTASRRRRRCPRWPRPRIADRRLGGSQLAARVQDELGLRDPGRPRPPLRQQHEPDPQRRRRQLAVLRQRRSSRPIATGSSASSSKGCRSPTSRRSSRSASSRTPPATRWCSACPRTSGGTRGRRSSVDPTTATGYSASARRTHGPLPAAGERSELRRDLSATTATRRTSTSTARSSRAGTCASRSSSR